MAEVVTIKVEGLQALGLRLQKLSREVATKAAARATSRAGSIVKKAAKNNLKSSPSIDSGTSGKKRHRQKDRQDQDGADVRAYCHREKEGIRPARRASEYASGRAFP